MVQLVEKKMMNETFGKEEIQLSSAKLSIKINAICGKDGDHWVEISPSINVSGYGDTPEEAKESFEHNINLFAEDLFSVKPSERIEYLKSIGWEQTKFFKKRLSKAFVDENGILQNLEQPKIKYLESVA